MYKIICHCLLLLSFSSVLAQELNEFQIKRTRSIQELLISNPDKAYAEAIEISKDEDELFSFYGKYYVANYFYNKSEFAHSRKLLISLIEDIEKSDIPESSKVH